MMRTLIAEDDVVSRHVLESLLVKWGYDVVVTENGNEAWEVLRQSDAPPLAILDWAMPGLDGAELCRRIRSAPNSFPPYIIMLTARQGKEDIVEGLGSGVDDYVTKPFDPEELQARLHVGERVLAARPRII